MSKPSEENLLDLISNNKEQFIIPIYQRGYNWDETHVSKLLDDLLEFYSNNQHDTETKYFVGNVITKEKPKPAENLITQFVVVDGQQRITTALLIALALYRVNDEDFDDLERIFILKEKGESKLKIDRLIDGQTLQNIIDDKINDLDRETRIFRNYSYILKRIKNDLNSVQIYNALKKSLVINVKLSNKENENKVFETINASGIPLSETDLIKNYIFFYAHDWPDKKEENKIMKEYEEIIKGLEETSNSFFRYLTVVYSSDKILPSKSKTRDIFEKFKKTALDLGIDHKNIDDVKSLISKIKYIASIWSYILRGKETNLERQFLLGVTRKNINTYFPVIAELFMQFDTNKNLEDYIKDKIVRLISKLIIFRNINGDLDKNITRDVPQMIKNFIRSNYDPTLEGFEEWLKAAKSNYSLPSLNSMISSSQTYPIDKVTSKAKIVLKAYEFSIKKNGAEIDWFQKFTLEHVMPRKFNKKWYPKIEEENEQMFLTIKNHISTIGNLTLLTKEMNSGLQEEVFQIKKKGIKNTEGLLNDALKMNQEFNLYEKWDIKTILDRGKKIVESIYEWLK